MATQSIALAHPVVSRKEAKRLSLKRYFPGTPCSHGHIAERATRNGECFECMAVYRLRIGKQPKSLSRSQAEALGWERYFTGKPCRQGHICERFTSSYGCVECARIREVGRVPWCKTHPFEREEYRKHYVAEHRDEIRARASERYFENRVKISAEFKLWYRNPINAQKAKVRARNAKIRRLGAIGFYTAEDVECLYNKQGGNCAACKGPLRRRFHVDHVMPLILGGSNWPSNLQLLCPRCNRKKWAKHPDDWAKEIGRLFV